eukprot:COSAG04_NODE_23292_length_341_cov_0.500000_1_plen_72_part_10
MAALTAADRDAWGAARDALVASGAENAAALHEIESAILHVNLDLTTARDQSALYETCESPAPLLRAGFCVGV